MKIDTAGKHFAVIVDEAHSSQSGETTTALKGMLNKDGVEAAIAAQLSDEEDDGLSDDAKVAVLRDALQRARQPNLSFFAFTATPKFKTKALFDEPGPSGASPFHEYTMRQAIEEGFIIDVLQNYTTYKRFFGLIKQVEDDPDVPRKKAAKALTRYLELHPVNIEQVVSVIVEHFRLYVMHELGGRAKAMVVTGSRLAAVKYKLAFDRYIKEQGYTGIRSLVAFSGTVEDPDDPGSTYTEVAMNDGVAESEIPETFERDYYRVLLVAEKYQAGFDQPLLQTMYVVKRLAGVQAVQTLSRLNRIAPGKSRIFVLDFANEEDDIYKAFKPYYETTPVGENAEGSHECGRIDAGTGALPVAGIVVSVRVRIACFARGHVLGPDQALDQFEFAVVADGGDAPGDGDILAPVDRAGLDHGLDLVQARLVGIGFLDQFFGPAVVVHVGEFVVAGPQAFDLGLLPVRRLGRLWAHPPEGGGGAPVHVEPRLGPFPARLQFPRHGLEAVHGELVQEIGIVEPDPPLVLLSEQVAVDLAACRLVSLEADETCDGGRGRNPVLG